MTDLELGELMEEAKYYLEQDPSMLNIIDNPAPWLSSNNNIPSQSINTTNLDNEINIQTSPGTNIAPFRLETITELENGNGNSNSINNTDIEMQEGSGSRAVLNVDSAEEMVEVPRQQAFNGTLQSADFTTRNKCTDLNLFLKQLSSYLCKKLGTLLKEFGGVKFWPVVDVNYKKVNSDAQIVEGHLRPKAQILFNDIEIGSVLKAVCDQIINNNSNFVREKSGLVIDQVLRASINFAKHNPLAGSSFEDLPTFVKNKKSVINVKNKDQRCFGYAILSALHPVEKHAQRPSKYEGYFFEHNLANIIYPVEYPRIPAIEDIIKINVNLYTFTHDGRKRSPVYISTKKFPISIDLLYWNGHYAWIKNFAGLFFDVNNDKKLKHFCKSCLGHFKSEQSLNNHKLNCHQGGFTSTIYTLPPPDTILKFKNVKFQQPVPFRIFADFESIIEPACGNAQHDPFHRKHTPCAVGFKLVSTIPEFTLPYEEKRGVDCVDWFLQRLLCVKDQCLKFLFSNQRMIFDAKAKELYDTADRCYLCDKPFGAATDKKNCKVRDHDHITGKFRGAAHSKCNLQLRKTIKIPVFFHNFRGYDSHLIVHSLPNFPNERVRVIGQSMEKYLILSWGDNIVFKDSLQFLNCSLERLANNLLKAGRQNFKQLLAEYSNPEEADLLFRKGVYPYDYMDSWDRFDEVQLPPKEAFFSTLRDENISDAEYKHAQNVWNKFKCRNIGEYHDLYLKTDVLLLADVWEGFSVTCMENYKLDPAHYVSAPHLSWDAMLKCTGVELELLNDPEMFRVFDGGIRGGICVTPKRYARANNPKCPKFDPTKPITWLPYIDCVNLYGAAMKYPMPTGGFRWLTRKEIDSIDWQAQTIDQPIGYTVVCDLEYPKELHDSHNDYPLAVERLQVNYNCISEKQVEINRTYRMARNSHCSKLMPNLMDKRQYTCDYYCLKRFLDYGLKLKKVHRVIAFNQSRWLQSYIDKNQYLRKISKQEHEKELFKLLNNSIYGKTCENMKKRSDIRLLTSKASFKKESQKPHCKAVRIFGDDLAAVMLEKLVSKIDKPTPVGFKVLEMSKLVMFEFYYDFLKPLYGEKVKLLMTDTDSLFLEVETPDFYQDMFDHKERFDLSFYPEGHPYRWMDNEKVVQFYLL